MSDTAFHRLVCRCFYAQQCPRIVGIIIFREKSERFQPCDTTPCRLCFEGVDVVCDGGAEHLSEVEITEVLKLHLVTDRQLPARVVVKQNTVLPRTRKYGMQFRPHVSRHVHNRVSRGNTRILKTALRCLRRIDGTPNKILMSDDCRSTLRIV